MSSTQIAPDASDNNRSGVPSTRDRQPTPTRATPTASMSTEELASRWEASSQQEKAARKRRLSRLAGVIMVSVSVIAALIIAMYSQSVNKNDEMYYFGYAICAYAAVGGVVLIGNASLSYDTARKKFNETEEIVFRAANFTRAVDALEEKLTLEYVTGLNSLLMDSYHDVTKNQAARSFKHSQWAMIAGFSLLLVGGIVAIAPTDPITKIAVAALTGIGTLVSGFISRTFLHSHAVSIAQLNRFFEQPLVNSYLLNAERVAIRLGRGRCEEMLVGIIQESISAARRVLTEPRKEAVLTSTTPIRKRTRKPPAVKSEEI